MSSTSETGHVKNVAKFKSIISFCTGYGTAYNPSKNSIKLPALNTILTNAENSVTEVTSATTAYNNVVNARMIVFDPLKKLNTKILNALIATDASQQTINDAKTISRKIQGKRASKIAPTLVADPSDPESVSKKSISASQQSFDNLLNHFSRLNDLLATEPFYTPNENDLKLSVLNTLLIDMKTKNSSVVNYTTVLSNSRIARNETLYKKDVGLVDIAIEVKSYIKSIFGASSSQYKQVSKLEFTRPKKK